MAANETVTMYEHECPAVSGNRKAEMALVQLTLTAGDVLGQLLTRLDGRDFCYDDCRFVYGEAVAMYAASEPHTDMAAKLSWFRRPDVVQRMREAKLDWVDPQGVPLPFGAIYELVTGGDFATVAHLDWYITELRRWRVVRGLRRLAWDLSRNTELEVPSKVLCWLVEKVDQLKEVAAPIMEESEKT